MLFQLLVVLLNKRDWVSSKHYFLQSWFLRKPHNNWSSFHYSSSHKHQICFWSPGHPKNILGSCIKGQYNAFVHRFTQLYLFWFIDNNTKYIHFRIRTCCHKLVNMRYFEQTMLFFILVSSLCLLKDPTGDEIAEISDFESLNTVC